jgi:hypothetical protein
MGQTTVTERTPRAGARSWLLIIAVMSLLGSGLGAFAGAVPAIAAAAAPSAPLAGKVAVSDSSVVFSWSPPASGSASLTHYNYDYRVSGTNAWSATATSGAATSVQVSGLTNGTKYWFRVRALNHGSESPWSASVAGVPRPIPSAPTTPTAKSDQEPGEALVSWAAPASDGGAPITSYVVRWRLSGNSAFTNSSSTPDGSTTQLTVPGLTPGSRYWFTVQAANNYGSGPTTAQFHVDMPTLPDAPSDVTPTGGESSVSLTWTAPTSPGLTGYDMRHRQAATGSPWVDDPSVGPDAVAATINSLTSGTSYIFEIRSRNAQTAGLWSTDVTASPTGTAPAAPSSFRAALGDTSGTFDLSWTAPSDAGGPITGYVVVYWPRGGRSTSVSVPASQTEYDLSGLPTGVLYNFQVKAKNAAGQSAYAYTTNMSPVYALPVLTIGTTNAAPITDTSTYIPGSYAVDPQGHDDVSPTSGTMQIKGHGNSTWGAAKKPYHLKLDHAATLMGLPSGKHWILLANALDSTQLRNAVALHLGQETDLAWTPHSAFVEVVLNGNYIGLYQLTEHVRIASNRVNIDELGSSDVSGDNLTGGYLLERDARYDPATDPGFRTTRNQPFTLEDPDPPAPEQASYIQNYVQSAEDSMFAANFADPTDGYAKYIDVPSFIDWYIVEEFVNNHDAWYSSANMYKPRDGKLFMGPLWDFDLTQGTTRAGSPDLPTGWPVRNASPWFKQLFKDPAFAAAVATRWGQLHDAIAALPAYVDSESQQIAAAEANDKIRWGYSNDFTTDVTDLKSWLTQRTDWIDQQYQGTGPDSPYPPTQISAKGASESVSLSWTAATNGPGPVVSYDVRHRLTSGNASSWTTDPSVDANATGATVTGLSNDTSYVFEVRAETASAPGLWSDDVTAVAGVPPTAPTALKATLDDSPGSTDLQWTAPPDNGDPLVNYVVYWWPAGGVGTSKNVDPSSTSTTISGLTTGVRYYFMVKAVNGAGAGPYSANVNTLDTRSASSP